MSVEFAYFYGDESTQFSFFRIPRQLMTAPMFKELSTDAKLLYGMLLDRMGLSARNGWYDDQGRVYIYFTVDEIRESLGCGNDKALKLLAELDTKKGIGLVERVKQGQGKPTKIYVKRFTIQAIPPQPVESAPPPSSPTLQGRCADLGYSDFQTSAFPMSRPRQDRLPGLGKSECSYNNQIQTDTSYTDPSIPQRPVPLAVMMDRYEQGEQVQRQIDYEALRGKYPFDDVDSLVELITDVLTSTAPAVRIGGGNLPTAAVQERYRRLDSSHIEYILDALKDTTTEIINIRAYLLTALYNAPVTMGPYYTAAVRHDFG